MISLRKAINEKCKDCIFDPQCGGGTWRAQVAQCSARNCPLWPIRPAPSSGPFANPPRDPDTVTREWLTAAVGEAKSAIGGPNAADPLPTQGVAAVHRKTPVPVHLAGKHEANV